jgi:hypothetical protein
MCGRYIFGTCRPPGWIGTSVAYTFSKWTVTPLANPDQYILVVWKGRPPAHLGHQVGQEIIYNIHANINLSVVSCHHLDYYVVANRFFRQVQVWLSEGFIDTLLPTWPHVPLLSHGPPRLICLRKTGQICLKAVFCGPCNRRGERLSRGDRQNQLVCVSRKFPSIKKN